jgi:DNA topoisomerase I
MSDNCGTIIRRTIKKTRKKSNPKTLKISKIYEYEYKKNDKVIGNSNKLDKLNKIRVPPNYKNVVICENDDKILGYGNDDKNRKQVIYHPDFIKTQQTKKHKHLLLLGENYEGIINQIYKDFNQTKDIKKRLIALCLIIIKKCDFRVSSDRKLALEYQHFGVVTLQCKHIKFKSNDVIDIEFIGKKGVLNKCVFNDKQVYKLLKKLKHKCEKDDDFIFKYDDGKYVEAKDINMYLKQFGNITTKNFRTWNANAHLFDGLIQYKKNFYQSDLPKLVKETFKNKVINSLIDDVANKLHNTRAICKKEYLNPTLLNILDTNFIGFMNSLNVSKNNHDNFYDFLESKN